MTHPGTGARERVPCGQTSRHCPTKDKRAPPTHLVRACDAITQRIRTQPVAPSPTPSCSLLNQDSLSLNPCSCRAGCMVGYSRDLGLSLSQGKPVNSTGGEGDTEYPILRVEWLLCALHCCPGSERTDSCPDLVCCSSWEAVNQL